MQQEAHASRGQKPGAGQGAGRGSGRQGGRRGTAGHAPTSGEKNPRGPGGRPSRGRRAPPDPCPPEAREGEEGEGGAAGRGEADREGERLQGDEWTMHAGDPSMRGGREGRRGGDERAAEAARRVEREGGDGEGGKER